MPAAEPRTVCAAGTHNGAVKGASLSPHPAPGTEERTWARSLPEAPGKGRHWLLPPGSPELGRLGQPLLGGGREQGCGEVCQGCRGREGGCPAPGVGEGGEESRAEGRLNPSGVWSCPPGPEPLCASLPNPLLPPGYLISSLKLARVLYLHHGVSKCHSRAFPHPTAGAVLNIH